MAGRIFTATLWFPTRPDLCLRHVVRTNQAYRFADQPPFRTADQPQLLRSVWISLSGQEIVLASSLGVFVKHTPMILPTPDWSVADGINILLSQAKLDKLTSKVLSSVKTENCSTIGSLLSSVLRKSCISLWFLTNPKGSPKQRCEIMSVVKNWMFRAISNFLVSPGREVHFWSIMSIHSFRRVSIVGSTPTISLPPYCKSVSFHGKVGWKRKKDHKRASYTCRHLMAQFVMLACISFRDEVTSVWIKS